MTAELCSDLSRAVGESLSATATTTRSWLLVEVPGGWSRDVSSSDALPIAAREAVSGWLARTDASRLYFVRRPGRVEKTSLSFFVSGGAPEPCVRRLELDSLDELAALDLDEAGEPVATPLVLVCGHGSRDRCCALRGSAVYGALAPELGDEELWISSHQGGHRFAANVLVLPSGLHFGRVEPEDALGVVTRALAGSIDLERFRGQARYEAVVQAADIAIRRSARLEQLGDLELAGVDGDRVRFVDRDGREWSAVVHERRGSVVPASCGADPEPQAAYVARVV